jgi:hypothetical protein
MNLKIVINISLFLAATMAVLNAGFVLLVGHDQEQRARRTRRLLRGKQHGDGVLMAQQGLQQASANPDAERAGNGASQGW